MRLKTLEKPRTLQSEHTESAGVGASVEFAAS
jgi:hypothetical protein